MGDGGNVKLEYRITGALMDTSRATTNLPDGASFRLSGVDGRFLGTLRKFPGFESVGTNDDSRNINTTMRYISGTLGSTTDAPEIRVGTFDEAFRNGDYIYEFTADERPTVQGVDDVTSSFLGAYDGNTFLETGWSAPITTGTTFSGGGFFLNFDGVYQIAFMYYSTDRKMYSGLSLPVTVRIDTYDIDGDPGNQFTLGDNIGLRINVPQPQDTTTWDQIVIYRTMNLVNPFDTYQGGVMYEEARVNTGTTEHTVGTKQDVILVQGRRYDPFADPNMRPPESGAGTLVDGIIIAGLDDPEAGLVWSNPYDTSNEEFSPSYLFEGEQSDGLVRRIIRAGENIFAFTDNIFYRLVKSGGNMAVYRFSNGRTPVSKDAVVAIGEDLIMVTPQGLMHMAGHSGSITPITAADKVLLFDWMRVEDEGQGGYDPTAISMAYDSTMGCVFILNRNRGSNGEMICLWEKTRSITVLENTYYSNCVSGPDLTGETGQIRAYFLSYLDNKIYSPAYGSPTYTTHTHLDGSTVEKFHIVVDGETTLQDVVTNLGFTPYPMYIASGENTGTWVTTADQLTLEVATGDQIEFSPVKFSARFWPYRTSPEERFGRKVITNIGLQLGNLQNISREDLGVDREAYPFFKVGAYADKIGSTQDTLEPDQKFIKASTLPDTTIAYINASGITLEPYVEQISHAGFELTSLAVYGTITQSNRNTGV